MINFLICYIRCSKRHSELLKFYVQQEFFVLLCFEEAPIYPSVLVHKFCCEER